MNTNLIFESSLLQHRIQSISVFSNFVATIVNSINAIEPIKLVITFVVMCRYAVRCAKFWMKERENHGKQIKQLTV